jgi:hypothetical protein
MVHSPEYKHQPVYRIGAILLIKAPKIPAIAAVTKATTKKIMMARRSLGFLARMGP